jgi:hypothetical protein
VATTVNVAGAGAGVGAISDVVKLTVAVQQPLPLIRLLPVLL